MLTRPGPQTEPNGSKTRAATPSIPAPTGAAVTIRGLSHSFGAVRALEGSTRRPRPGEVLGIVGPSGCGKSTLLELVAGLREPDRGQIAVGVATAAPRSASALRLHAPARPAAALAARDRQRRARASDRGATRAAEARRRRRRSSTASASPASSSRAPTSSPVGCASGSPSFAPCWRAARCCSWTSPSPRSTRSPAPRCRAGSPGCSPATGTPSCWSPTTSRRRSTSPTASSC